MSKNADNRQPTLMDPALYEELHNGLLQMFRTCVERQGNRGDTSNTRKAGAEIANALMQLHRDFTPRG